MKPLYVIHHVAKCGGTTIRTWLEKHLDTNKEFLFVARSNIYAGRSPFIDKDISDFVNIIKNDRKLEDIKVIFGHNLPLPLIQDMFKDRDIKLITMTKHPIDILTSRFNDNRSHILRGVKVGKLYEPTQADFMEWYKEINRFHLAVWYGKWFFQVPPKQFIHRLKEFDLVLHTPELDSDLKTLADWLELPYDYEPKNTSRGNLLEYHKENFNMQPEERERFNAENKIGQNIYLRLMKIRGKRNAKKT